MHYPADLGAPRSQLTPSWCVRAPRNTVRKTKDSGNAHSADCTFHAFTASRRAAGSSCLRACPRRITQRPRRRSFGSRSQLTDVSSPPSGYIGRKLRDQAKPMLDNHHERGTPDNARGACPPLATSHRAPAANAVTTLPCSASHSCVLVARCSLNRSQSRHRHRTSTHRRTLDRITTGRG